MPMTKCPECAKDISTAAYQCPHCGYALKPPPVPKKSKGPAVAIGCVIAAVVGFIGVAVIGLLTAIAIPAFLQYRTDAQRGLCINNLRLIDHAKEVLAIKNGWQQGHVIAETPEAIWKKLDPFIDGTNILYCPQAPGRHYIYGPIDTTPKCPIAESHPEHTYNPVSATSEGY